MAIKQYLTSLLQMIQDKESHTVQTFCLFPSVSRQLDLHLSRFVVLKILRELFLYEK